MDYANLLKTLDDEKYLINMVSVEDIIRLGASLGLNKTSRVLDLCCGYGTMLKIWRDVFGISGVGIDRDSSFIEAGSKRLPDDAIRLVCGDVLLHSSDVLYDVVVCTELSTGLFNTFHDGISFLEQFLKPSGILVFGKLFSEIQAPPKELVDFDGRLPTLNEIYDEVRQSGYFITSLVSGDRASWERYVTRDSKISLSKMRQNPDDISLASWAEKWQRMYFTYRRHYESWGLFGVEKL
jgi:SAM-dependent methyltransferase